MTTKYKKYFQSIKYLESIINLLRKDYMQDRNNPIIYLQRVKYLLNLIGNPESDFEIIHITGTSGKGSTSSYIHSILTQAKIKSGLFLSPHTTTTIERIKVGNKYISPNQFVNLINYLKPYIEETSKKSIYGTPSYFEIIFVLSLLYFQKQKCKYVILEVGCGGKYDATNSISKSKISIITNINLDHAKILGNTLEAIARDKAGIIKSNNIYCLTAESKQKILEIFQQICKSKKVKLILIKSKIKKINCNFKINFFKFKNDQEEYIINTKGRHQIYNASLAVQVAKILKVPIKYILSGLKKTKLPCRFEIIQKNPLVILDGAHNEAKIKSVVENLTNLKYDKLLLIIGIKEDKNSKKILKQIIPYVGQVFITSINNEGQSIKYLQNLKKISLSIDKNLDIKIFIKPKQALDHALKKIKSNNLLLITGSLYLTGELRKKWYNEEYILKNRKSY